MHKTKHDRNILHFFHCPHCHAMLRVVKDAAGNKAKCPLCSRIIEIPEQGVPEHILDEYLSEN